MKSFAALYETLDQTTSTNAKVAAMVSYLQAADPADAAWAVYFLSGKRIKRLLGSSVLKQWLKEEVSLPEWLVDDCRASVGDMAETIALLVEPTELGSIKNRPLTDWIEQSILPLRKLEADEQRTMVTQWWRALDTAECFIVNKLITGSFRVGVSKLLVARALAQVADLPREVILHRLMGAWEPTAEAYAALLDPDTRTENNSQPYPFFLASPIEQAPIESVPNDLGAPADWQAEWKWDGIRAQLIKREGEIFIWSRGEDLITHQFPEVAQAATELPDGTVLDGELVVWREGIELFSELQRRLGRKKVTTKFQQEVPVRFLVYDCMEYEGQDIREQPLRIRRQIIETLVTSDQTLMPSPVVAFQQWDDLTILRAESRERRVEGLMLKRLDSTYQTGRKRGDWWKWKVDPLTIDAVMIYAQAGTGRRANLFTDYTFAVWDQRPGPDGQIEQELVPVAKAYSGLTDAEIRRLDNWIRRNTIERFGPVRSVKLQQVFELAYEAIAESKRHKSGVALRFPRILRWREDLSVRDADTLQMLQELIAAQANADPDLIQPVPSVATDTVNLDQA